MCQLCRQLEADWPTPPEKEEPAPPVRGDDGIHLDVLFHDNMALGNKIVIEPYYPKLGDTVYYWAEVDDPKGEGRVLAPFVGFIMGTNDLVQGKVGEYDFSDPDVFLVWVPLLQPQPQPKRYHATPKDDCISTRWGLDGKPIPVV